MKISINGLFVAMLITVLALVAGCAPKPPAPAPDISFSAIFTIESAEDAKPQNFQVSFTRDMQRLDMLSPETGTTIVRVDKGVVWSIIPDMKMAIEMPIRPENNNPLFHNPDRILKYEVLGEETMGGHPVIKERLEMQNEGGDVKAIYRWFAKDIGWPLRAEAVDGSWKLSFDGLRTGPQDPALFELPAGVNMISARKAGSHM